jgi:uncharacterized membrane protein YccC
MTKLANWFRAFDPGWLRLEVAVKGGLATVTAMVVIVGLGLDKPYWAFWTAYIVIAGSTGESLRKIIYRVAGATLGALCLVLAVYTRVINYAWMVFWITTFVALMYSLEGVPPARMLSPMSACALWCISVTSTRLSSNWEGSFA